MLLYNFLAPSKTLPLGKLLQTFFVPKPNEIEMAAKTTPKEAIFVTDASVNLCIFHKENVPFITLKTSSNEEPCGKPQGIR